MQAVASPSLYKLNVLSSVGGWGWEGAKNASFNGDFKAADANFIAYVRYIHKQFSLTPSSVRKLSTVI
jgi:hypothetical protein